MGGANYAPPARERVRKSGALRAAAASIDEAREEQAAVRAVAVQLSCHAAPGRVLAGRSHADGAGAEAGALPSGGDSGGSNRGG